MVRSIACLVAVALATLLSACCPEDAFIPTAIIRDTTKNPAFLRIIHAAADAEPAKTVLDSRQADFIPALGYLAFLTDVNEAKYYRADTAARLISFVGRSGGLLASKTIKLEAGQFYTAYLHGRSGSYQVLLTTDTVKPPPPAGQLGVRVVNLAPDSPPIDLRFTTSPGNPLASNLAYGQVTDYGTRQGADLNRPGMTVTETVSGDTLMHYPKDIIFLPSGAIMTLVISGEVRPSGTAPLLSFALFFESYFDPDDGLYGSLPIRLNLTAIRLINIVPMKSFVGLCLSFYDRAFDIQYDGINDGYRRNYPGQGEVWNIGSLTNPENNPKGYFLQSSSQAAWQYRTELRSRDLPDPGDQDPISDPDSLFTQVNQRYTVVAFGDSSARVRTAELNDNVALPAPGMSRVRFFHGGIGTIQTQQLRLRVGGAQSPSLQGYGDSPTANDAFDAPSGGAVTLEVVDQNGAVILSSQHTLDAGKVYTVFLAPKADKNGWLLRPISDELRR